MAGGEWQETEDSLRNRLTFDRHLVSTKLCFPEPACSSGVAEGVLELRR